MRAPGSAPDRGLAIRLLANTDRAAPWAQGSKTWGLVELLRAGLPVPETVVIDGRRLLDAGAGSNALPPLAIAAIEEAVAAVESACGKMLGDVRSPRPLLLAVRCGDKHVDGSLPESLINVGCPASLAPGLPASAIADRDAQAARVTAALRISEAEAELSNLLPREQAVRAVGWMLRGLAHAAPHSDRALLLQRMVHGNLGPRSCVGTAYTRNPYTGERVDYGRYLPGTTGVRLIQLYPDDKRDLAELARDIPEAYATLRWMLDRLEDHHQDVRFVEFVVEEGDVYLLQNTVRNRRAGVYPSGQREGRGARPS